MTVELVSPPPLEHGFVQGRFVTAVADTLDDEDRYPDLRAALGTVRLIPVRPAHLVGGARPAAVVKRDIVLEIDSQGYVVDVQSEEDQTLQPGAWIVAGRYRVEPVIQGGGLDRFTIDVSPEHTKEEPCDLVLWMPISVPPQAIEVVRIADRELAIKAAAESREFRNEAQGFRNDTQRIRGEAAAQLEAIRAAANSDLEEIGEGARVELERIREQSADELEKIVTGNIPRATPTRDGVMPSTDKAYMDSLPARLTVLGSRSDDSLAAVSRADMQEIRDVNLGDTSFINWYRDDERSSPGGAVWIMRLEANTPGYPTSTISSRIPVVPGDELLLRYEVRLGEDITGGAAGLNVRTQDKNLSTQRFDAVSAADRPRDGVVPAGEWYTQTAVCVMREGDAFATIEVKGWMPRGTWDIGRVMVQRRTTTDLLMDGSVTDDKIAGVSAGKIAGTLEPARLPAATTSTQGAQSPAHVWMLNNATHNSSGTGGTLVRRDADGRAAILDPTFETHIANKRYVDDQVNAARFRGDLGSRDLNTVTEAGAYGQAANSNATGARNYPAPGRAGSLVVSPWSGSTGRVVQTYITRSGDADMFARHLDGTTWSPWTEYVSKKYVDDAIAAAIANL